MKDNLMSIEVNIGKYSASVSNSVPFIVGGVASLVAAFNIAAVTPALALAVGVSAAIGGTLGILGGGIFGAMVADALAEISIPLAKLAIYSGLIGGLCGGSYFGYELSKEHLQDQDFFEKDSSVEVQENNISQLNEPREYYVHKEDFKLTA